MNEITKIRTNVATPATLTIEDMLNILVGFGSPRLHHLKGGWYACIEMNTSALGAKFEVASDFNRATPNEALRQLLDRVSTVVK